MNSDLAGPTLSAFAARWRFLVVRGVAALLFGFLAIFAPRASLLALVILWGAYALVDGVFNVILAIRGARTGMNRGWLLFQGLVSVAAGVITFLWPGITALALLTVIAVWAVLTGVAEIAFAIRLRHVIRGEWLLAASGVVSIVFGVLLAAFPGAGALALAWMIGVYAVVFGALLVGFGFRIHRWGEGTAASGGTPSHA
ncbi:HdeD family acid-resistance protein [Anaeromyxobacter oryzae]|uniref:Membrane protein n=1 Tax=Anaeromyxobacter oryzae TaxID=2918170 RepID=A0ABM7X047_9BACT|nr:HdeD family acid-resistance protein [Anaeromyxobacter oryzae]BDG05115.1 membrane protein [Anaeromyxobacter oryzae]